MRPAGTTAGRKRRARHTTCILGFLHSPNAHKGKEILMMRVLFAFLMTAVLGAGLVGCRAEVETDDTSTVVAPR